MQLHMECIFKDCGGAGIMGPYPQYMLDEGKETNRFYTSAGVAYDRVENSDGSVGYSLIYPKKTTLRHRLHVTSPPGPPGEMTEDDLFVDFVGAMLRVDPAERPSAGQCLLHPWLDDVDSLDVAYVNE
jgi:serine/threonine protein kinase